MITTEKQIFKNLFTRHMTGYYKHCPFMSIGNIAHWIYVYSSLHIAEVVQIGEEKVYYGSKVLCLHYPGSKHQIPIFHGFEKEDKDIDYKQDIFLRGLNLPKYEKEELFKDVIRYMNEDDLKMLDLYERKIID